MPRKKITRKVISKVSKVEKEPEVKVSKVDKVADEAVTGEATPKTGEPGERKKACFFCQSKTDPSYTDTAVLRRFTTDRAKIVPRVRSNLCSKHQRLVTKQIKYARHLSLLPFTPKV